MVFILISMLASNSIMAGKYENAMASAMKKLFSATDQQSYLDAVNAFERIGSTEENKWLPYYYAGLGFIMVSHTTQDGALVDDYLDKAQIFVDKASELSSENDEIFTLQGYIYMMKVVVDPETRGPEYSGLAMQSFGRAVGLNQANPRALLLLGRMQMGTDQFFGNDITQSCDMIMKAAQMFDHQPVESSLAPAWGREMAEVFVKECQSN